MVMVVLLRLWVVDVVVLVLVWLSLLFWGAA